MKKTLLLLLLILATTGANAQWKLAKFKQNFHQSQASSYFECEKGSWIAYSENKNGTVHLYCNAPEDGIEDLGTFPKSMANKYLEFTGYYVGQVRDPIDDYVNVRKGPGTNYPVVGKCYTGCYIYFMKTENNWLKVYTVKSIVDNYGVKSDVGFFYLPDCLEPNYYYDVLIFLGYMYKDRVKTPTPPSGVWWGSH